MQVNPAFRRHRQRRSHCRAFRCAWTRVRAEFLVPMQRATLVSGSFRSLRVQRLRIATYSAARPHPREMAERRVMFSRSHFRTTLRHLPLSAFNNR
jgi:hypothetical protein